MAAPVDPGVHEVTAIAPRKRKWESKLEITNGLAQGAVQRTIVVPKLEDAPKSQSAESHVATNARARPTPGETQRIFAYALGGLSVVSIGVGSYFGLRAIAKNSRSNDEGCLGNQCPQEAAATRRSASSAGNVSTVAFIVGGAALGSGIALYMMARGGRTETQPMVPHASLTVTREVATFGVQGAW